MAELSKIFKSNDLYEAWRDNKDIPSNVLAVVLDKTGETVEKVAFGTNDITGKYETYEVEKAQEQPLNAEGCMFGDYVGKPLYEIGSGEDYPCSNLTITVGEYGVTTYEGYIYIKYNRGLTEEEVTAEKAKITGDNIESTDIEVNTIAGASNILEIIWKNKDENLSTDTMFINYDGYSICSFNNVIYKTYCNTAIIMMGHTAQITQQNWNNNLESGDVIYNNQSSSIYPMTPTGEYHIMIMTKDYGNINFPISILYNHGVDVIKQYDVNPQASFTNNGLRAYIFNFQDVPVSTVIDNIEIYWGNATYKMNIV